MKIPSIKIHDIIRLERNNYSHKTENRFCYVISCRLSGEGVFSYNGKTRSLKRGEILFIPMGADYIQKSDKETLIFCNFSVSGQIASEIAVYEQKNADRICELFIKAEQLWKQKPQNYELLCLSVLYEIIANTDMLNIRQEAPDLLHPAMEYLISSVFKPDFSLDEMCRVANISRPYLNLLFRRKYHCPPIVYVNQMRIERAKQLIITGTFLNEEIATTCGFKDVKYFYTVFKRITGLTTKEYKQQFEKALS